MTIHVGDVGLVLTATLVDENATAISIATATTKVFHFRKPDGTTVTEAGSFTTDGSDGKLYYQFAEDDLDMAGAWWWQLYVVLASGSIIRSSRAHFDVEDYIMAEPDPET